MSVKRAPRRIKRCTCTGALGDSLHVIRKAIDSIRPALCDKIIAERHFAYLRSKRIISQEDEEEICSKPTSRQRAGLMLDRIACHPRGLDILIESIQQERTQTFLIVKITDSVQRARNSKLQSHRDSPCSACGPSVSESTNKPTSWMGTSSFFDLDKTLTVLHHPEGESSLPSHGAVTASLHSFHLPVMDQGSMMNAQPQSHSLSTILPRPGDPGAPPLPEELQSVPEEVCSSSTDADFHPLRSRSLSPQ